VKIDRKDVPSMTIEQFADSYNLTMKVRERRVPADHPSRYYAHFESCEVMSDDGFLFDDFGNGMTAEEAISVYADRIQLKRIVIGAYTPERREVDVPRLVKE